MILKMEFSVTLLNYMRQNYSDYKTVNSQGLLANSPRDCAGDT